MRAADARPTRSEGFTLLELLVVMVILGLLASYVGPKYFSQIAKSKRTVAKSQVEAFERALDAFRLDVGRYPNSDEGLSALITRPANTQTWNGPYLAASIPLDPWGNAYVYHRPGAQSEFEVISYGQDGQPGGLGEAEDIVRPVVNGAATNSVTGKAP